MDLVIIGIIYLKLKWKKSGKVTGYKVYLYNSSKKKYEVVGTTTSKSYTIKKLKSAKEYKIKIRAYRTVKKKKYCTEHTYYRSMSMHEYKLIRSSLPSNNWTEQSGRSYSHTTHLASL